MTAEVRRRGGRPRSPAYDQRRKSIAAGAATLFITEGVGSVTMDDIAAEAGLAKPSLYHYFRTKDDIIFAIHSQADDFLTSRLRARAESGSKATERLRGVFLDTFDLVDRFPGFSRVVMEQVRQLPKELHDEVLENRERYSRQIEQIFAEGIATGEFVGGNTRLLTLALLGMVNWSNQWYSPQGKQTPDEIADYFFDVFVKGIEPRL